MCKLHLDSQYNIFHWGSTIQGDSTLCSKLVMDDLLHLIFLWIWMNWNTCPKCCWFSQSLLVDEAPDFLTSISLIDKHFSSIVLHVQHDDCIYNNSNSLLTGWPDFYGVEIMSIQLCIVILSFDFKISIWYICNLYIMNDVSQQAYQRQYINRVKWIIDNMYRWVSARKT